MNRVVVPQLFENMEEATIGSWLVREGQSVNENQPLCEIITEKTTLELPSPFAGTVRRLVVGEKAVVPTNFIIALIGEQNEELPDIEAENAALQPVIKTPEIVAPIVAAPIASAPGSRLRATPAARRAAKERGVSLEEVAQKFPNKVLSEDDVKTFSEAR